MTFANANAFCRTLNPRAHLLSVSGAGSIEAPVPLTNPTPLTTYVGSVLAAAFPALASSYFWTDALWSDDQGGFWSWPDFSYFDNFDLYVPLHVAAVCLCCLFVCCGHTRCWPDGSRPRLRAPPPCGAVLTVRSPSPPLYSPTPPPPSATTPPPPLSFPAAP
jgi:hypothetical protein